ncbi:MAG: DNA-directed RNA polymerase subunit alpha [Candidatus Pacebacteria bacterium]|nr:DNA-directed RNA polymerase subunit alpha [Candidatus Paceibacterota bacterium]MCF7857071.1 DNA-directed RNA polymerase subunit alpha [Candidatus Paceibacterota bacterium]
MLETNVALPSKPRVIKEEEFSGVFEIDGLYPGYGHTLGNSLRRIILSSLPGAAITQVKIDGAQHEFSTIAGVKEDVITILLNLKRVRLLMHSDTPMTLSLKVTGGKVVTAADISAPSQIEILNPEQVIAEITDKSTTLSIDLTVEHGLGYVPREVHQKDKVDIGTIALDAVFTPIRRVNYEVENMRVGDRTDYNRLRVFIETDGTLTPRQALENSIEIMVHQLKAIIGFQETVASKSEPDTSTEDTASTDDSSLDTDVLKTRIETLDLSTRTQNALETANIRTVGGLVRKKKDDILALDGIGPKGVDELEVILGNLNISFKE